MTLRLAAPVRVTADTMDEYEVHHRYGRTTSCQLKDLVVVTKLLHERLTKGLVKESVLGRDQILVEPLAVWMMLGDSFLLGSVLARCARQNKDSSSLIELIIKN